MNLNFFKQTRILDGGMGQELLARGMDSTGTLWSAKALIEPKYHKLIEDIHRDFVKSGAEIIVTATFTSRRIRLRENGIEDQYEKLNKTAGEIAQKVKKDYPDFEFSSLSDKFIELGFNFDGRYFEKYEVAILSTQKLQNNHHSVSLWFEEFPVPFYVPWKVLDVKIMENDPNRKYFDLPERQYRMSGFPDVFLHMTQECEKNNE